MDTIKHTKISAESEEIEIVGGARAVTIIKENVKVSINTVAVQTPPVEVIPEEIEPALPAAKDVAATAAETTEAVATETAPAVAFSEIEPVEDEFLTEAAFIDAVSDDTVFEPGSLDEAEIKAIADIEAHKAEAVAAAGAQALAKALEKREAEAGEQPPQYEDSFADLETVELQAIDMVKKEQEANTESSSDVTTEAATAVAGITACPAGFPCDMSVVSEVQSGQAPVCPAGIPCGAFAAEAAETNTESSSDAATEAAETNIDGSSDATTEAVTTAAPAAQEQAPKDDSSTVRVIGVRFRTAGKVYYFDPGQWEVRHGTHVIVETVRGIEYGTVAGIPMDVKASKVPQPLKEVIRVATPEDTKTEQNNRIREKEAYRICQEKIRAHGLEMKLINAEYTFDNSKVLFYFTADGRVDFRDLVKDLASVFRTRIELRQIGVRDETKILGGYGICGRPLCCHSWMSDFIPVSIKMAKEQNLSLNPGKISGVCGRLMCCLKNESDTYEELNRSLPKVGDEVQGSDGLSGQVESVNVLRQTVRILVEVDDEKEYHEYHVGDITILRRRRRGGNRNRKDNTDPKEVQELERLENQDRQPSRGERQERGDRGDRGDRQDRGDRVYRKDRGDRQDRGERQDRANREDRGSRRNNKRREN